MERRELAPPPSEPQRPALVSQGLLLGLFACLIALSVGFGGGWWFGRQSAQASSGSVADSSAVRDALPTGVPPSSGSTPEDLRRQFEIYWDVWDLVAEQFYHEQPIDQQKLVYGSIEGLLKSLEDPYTFFEEPEDAEHTREEMSGQFEGIGAYIEFLEGEVTIVSPIEGSPAEENGLKRGDQILEVDGTDLSELLKDMERGEAAAEAAKMIRGPKGTTVHLKIHRPKTGEIFELDLVRAAIPLISVRGAMIDEIGYLHISQFSDNTAVELDAKLEELLQQQPKALVLDLRDNPGGLVDAAQEVLGRFVEQGVMMYQQDSSGELEEIPLKREKGEGITAFDVPMIVLVNGGSASASEIIAGALEDHGRAELIGEKTFGKGSVQNVQRLRDGSSARITIAHWLTPNKREIHKKGITPEYVVLDSEDAGQYPVSCTPGNEPEEGQTSCGDAQLFWALKVLRNEGAPTPPPPITPTPPTGAEAPTSNPATVTPTP